MGIAGYYETRSYCTDEPNDEYLGYTATRYHQLCSVYYARGILPLLHYSYPGGQSHNQLQYTNNSINSLVSLVVYVQNYVCLLFKHIKSYVKIVFCGISAHVRIRTNGRDLRVPVKCIFTGIIRIFYVRRASFVRM